MTGKPTRPRARGLAKLTSVTAAGAERAAERLSELLGREILLDATGVHFGGSARLLDLVGGPGAAVAGVYLRMGEEITGHVMLLFELEEARSLVDQLLELEPGTTQELDELGRSALGEVGNITASSFLNELGDAVKIELHLSPPEVVEELAGALLNSVLADVASLGGDILILETVFIEAGSQVKGFVLLTPDPESLTVLLDRLVEAA